ncbi:hypothetical protein Pse7367_3640 [Thalassoporum mexicanum PCC 7367]|uniref:DUF3084 domain-containing protein n=1 Tax=Thalassoporum mexicanum TaxID=3457544 RepID=UPI00029FCC17|nr:DUF3084 domain-containing protein [Pseudanabaena sp. PCC 7367]AFY71873.1 hypothetical protein Pse7367_3640 [Pseudanabaena sp. PCC 7367]
MAGYVLIVAILVLSGIIATAGDRIGSKVGKARLSIFNLRPKKTATLITIVTGGVISASTLGVLLITSSQLRDGLFRLESIRADLADARAQQERIETELNDAKAQREEAQAELDIINRSLSASLVKQAETEKQLEDAQGQLLQTQEKLNQVLEQEQELIDEVASLLSEQEEILAESEQLKIESTQLQGEQAELEASLEQISNDRQALREKIDSAQNRLNEISTQRSDLAREVENLEYSRDRLSESIQALRRGSVAIQADQVLAAAVTFPELSRSELRQAITGLVQEANRNSIELLGFLPGQAPTEPVITVTETQLNNLLDRIGDGRSYVIRLLSAGNYVRQETSVAIVADVTPNQIIFNQGDVIASLNFEADLSFAEKEDRVSQLFSLANFRAKQEGIVYDPITGRVGVFSQKALNELLDEINDYDFPFTIQVVTKSPIFTGSPLAIELLVRRADGEVIRRFG